MDTIFIYSKFKISVSTWNDNFELPDGSYSVSDIQDYFVYIIKKHETVTNNLPIRIYVNKIENRIASKIETVLSQLSTPETMKLRRSTKNKIIKDKIGKKVPHLEITEEVLVNCYIVNNGYQHDSRGLYAFVPNKSFGHLLDISATKFIFLKILSFKVFIEIWFTDQNSKHLEIKDKINFTLAFIKQVTYKKCTSETC